MDFESLMLNEAFLRTLFTILDTAGMFGTNYRPDGRDLAFYEGRRSLGLDILASARAFGGPDALIRILEAEKKTPTGGSIGRRNTDDTDGSDDADGSGDQHVPGSGLVFLEYGPEPVA